MLVPMTPAQCRAGRALVELTQPALAESAKLGLSTVVDFEKSRRTVAPSSVALMKAALEVAGVEFIPENGGGAGVRLRDRSGSHDEGKRPDELDATNDD